MVATAAAQAQRRSTKAKSAVRLDDRESPGFFVHQRGGLTHWVFSSVLGFRQVWWVKTHQTRVNVTTDHI